MADFKMKLPGITDKDLENSLDKLIEKATTAKKETEQLVNSGEKAIKSLENTATAVSSTIEKAVRKTTSEATKAVDLTIKQLKRLNNMKIGVKDGKSMMSYSRAYSQLFGEKEIKALEANEKKYNRTLELAKKSINDYREFVEKTQNEFEKYDGSGSTEPLVKGLYDEKAVEEITNKYIEKLKESNVKVTKIKNDIIYREKAYSAYKTLQTEGTKIGTPKTIEDMKSLLEIMSKQVILVRKIKSLTDNIGYSDKKYDDMKLLDVEQNIRQFFTKASGNEYINKFFKDLVDTVETEYNSFNEKIQKVATERDFSGFMEVPVKEIKKGFDESLKLAESYVKKLNKLTTNSFTGKGRNAFYNLNKIPDSNISEESKWSLVGQMSSLLAQGGNVNKESGGYQYYEKLLAESEEFANFAAEVTRQVKANMESGWKELEKIAVPEGVQNPVVVEKEQTDAIRETTDALEKKADAQREVNEVESIYARAQKIRNEGNVTDYDGNDWNYSKTMLYKYYDGIIELQSKISKTTDAHILDDLNKDLDESKVEFVALYDTIDAFFEGKLNSRSIKANVRNLFNQLAPQSDIDAYIKMITSSDNTHPVIQTPQIDNATSKVDSNNRANPDINSLPLFNEESTGQLAMQIEGVTEASWDLGKAEKSVTEDIQFMNTALEGQIELVEVLESKLNDKRSIIQDKIDSYTQDYNTDTERLSNALMQDNEELNILWIENMYKAMARDFNSIEENKKALAELNNEVYEMKQITAVDARNIIFDEVAKKANLALYYVRELSDAEKEYLTSNNKAKKAGNVAELYDQYSLLLDINDEIEWQYGKFKTKSNYINMRMNEMNSNGRKTRGIGKYLKASFGEEYDKEKSEFIQMREDIIKLNPVLKQFRKQYREWIKEAGAEIGTPQHLTQDDFVKKFLGQFEYKDTFSDFQSTILQALQSSDDTTEVNVEQVKSALLDLEKVSGKSLNAIIKNWNTLDEEIQAKCSNVLKNLGLMNAQSEFIFGNKAGSNSKAFITDKFVILQKAIDKDTESLIKLTSKLNEAKKAGVNVAEIYGYQKTSLTYNPDNYFNSVPGYEIQEKAQGVELHQTQKNLRSLNNSIAESQRLASASKEHLTKFIQDWIALNNLGIQVDPSKGSNFFYSAEKGFEFIDLCLQNVETEAINMQNAFKEIVTVLADTGSVFKYKDSELTNITGNLASQVAEIFNELGLLSSEQLVSLVEKNYPNWIDVIKSKVLAQESRQFSNANIFIEQAQAAEEVVKANNDIVKSEQQIERQSKQLAKQLAAMYSVVNPETINKVAGMLSEKFRNSESLKVDENGFINTDVIDEFELFASAPPSFQSIFDILAEDADFFIEKIDDASVEYKKLRDYVSKSKILIDSKLKSEFGDKKEWDRIRTTIGMNTMTTNSNIGTPINKFLEEMNEALGTSFDITGSAQDGIRQLFNELERGRNGISQLDEQIKNREIQNIEDVTNTFITNQEKIDKLNGKKISAPNPRIRQIKQETSAIEEQIPVIEEHTKTIVENTNAKKKNKQSKEDTNLLSGSYTIADGKVEALLRRKVAEINKTTGMEKAKYRILTDAQNEVLSAEISYVNKELGQVVTEMYALHKANEEIEGDEDALIFKGKKLSQDTIAAEEKKQKAIEATNEALRQQLERIKNIDTKVNDPKNNINNVSDIETLAYAKNAALNKISSLQGNSNATKSDIGEVKNLVNEYERVTNEIIKATQLSSKQISSDDNIVRIESLITNITKLIEKTKEYAGTSIEIDKMIKSLEKEQEVLRKTSDILQGKSKDNNGNILSMSSKDASDKYYSALSDYKKNAAVFDQLKIEQDNKEKQKAQDYQFLIDKINELTAARKKLQSLESNARKNPTLDYSAEIQQQKDLIQTLERVVELNKVDFNTMSSDGDFWNTGRVKDYTDALDKAVKAEKDLNNQRQLFNEKDQQIAIDNYKKALSDLVNTYKSFASNANGNSNLSIQINAQQIADAQQRVRELGDAAEKAGVSASDLENLFTNSFREISSSVGTIGTKTLDGYINKINTLSEKMEENRTATDKTRLRIDELKKSISSIIKNADFSTDEGIGSFLAQIESAGRKLPSILSEIESLGKFDSKMLNIEGSIKGFDKLSLQTIKAKSLLTSLKDEYKSLQESLAKNNGQFGKEQIDQLTRIDTLVSKLNKEAYGKGTLVPETTGLVTNLKSLADAMAGYAKTEWNAQQIGKTLQTKTGELVGTFKTEDGTIHKLTVSMNSLSNGMNVVKDEVGQSTGFFKEMKNTLTGMGKRFSYIFSGYVLFHKMTSAFRDGLNVLKEYDSALTTISYTMDLTKNQLGKLGDSAVQMAKDLSMSLDNAMAIYQIYANMNTTAQEINETATPTAILSNLSGVDTSTASDQVQGILQQFSMLKDGANNAADASMHVVDVLDKISANVAIDYAKGIGVITDAVTATGQVAYDAGLSFEQLAAISAKVAERTREDGSTIGCFVYTIKTI